jgi:hypothetical protein
MSTATRTMKPAYRQAEPQTLQQRIKSVREEFPGLREARLVVLNLKSEENGLLAKLQTPAPSEDPHVHDSTRTKLAVVREKIGPAQNAERAIELEASKSAMAEFLPEHSEAAAAFTDSLANLLQSQNRMLELRDLATAMRLPLTSKSPFFGLEQLQGIRPVLLQILSLWKQ